MRIDGSVCDKVGEKHNVCLREIGEAFLNRTAPVLKEVRTQHATNPPTWWFLARTDKCRILKIAYMVIDGEIVVKTAYEPEAPTISFYCKKTKIAEADI